MDSLIFRLCPIHFLICKTQGKNKTEEIVKPSSFYFKWLMYISYDMIITSWWEAKKNNHDEMSQNTKSLSGLKNLLFQEGIGGGLFMTLYRNMWDNMKNKTKRRGRHGNNIDCTGLTIESFVYIFQIHNEWDLNLTWDLQITC